MSRRPGPFTDCFSLSPLDGLACQAYNSNMERLPVSPAGGNEMTTALAVPPRNGGTLENVERVLIQGDLAGLSPDERLTYYREVCRSLGINPLTQPFSYLMLNRRLVLYATKDCAAQLRRLHDISLEVVSREVDAGDILTVHVRASMPGDGRNRPRQDEDYGSVSLRGLEGEARANAILKAL